MPLFFRILLVPSVFALLSAAAVAANNKDCDSKDGDHIGQLQCIGERMQAQDVELDRVYQSALAALPETDPEDSRKSREQLRKAQSAWLHYKVENCTLIGGMEGGSNLWVTHFAALCQENATKERIIFLKGIVGDSPQH